MNTHSKNFQKPIVVLSAVNLTEGGPLSILEDAVNCFVENFISYYHLVLLVHNKNLVKHICGTKQVRIIEYNYPKRSWLLRIWFEYIHSYFISEKINPYLWFALHDVTPNVKAQKKIVYCQNPAPFYKITIREIAIEKSLIFFKLFYSLFYRINIRSNKYVVVQQQWIREEFEKRYNIKNIIVSYPDVKISNGVKTANVVKNKYRFLYPSLPRVFKNFETLLKSAEILEKQCWEFEVTLTFDGSENKYASELIKKYAHIPAVKFIGIQKREEMIQLYNNASCLVFSSRLETWGLPISEMKLFNKPMLLSNCNYARETVGSYSKVCFFEPNDAVQLSELMKKAITGRLEYDHAEFALPKEPFTKTWKELFSFVLKC